MKSQKARLATGVTVMLSGSVSVQVSIGGIPLAADYIGITPGAQDETARNEGKGLSTGTRRIAGAGVTERKLGKSEQDDLATGHNGVTNY